MHFGLLHSSLAGRSVLSHILQVFWKWILLLMCTCAYVRVCVCVLLWMIKIQLKVCIVSEWQRRCVHRSAFLWVFIDGGLFYWFSIWFQCPCIKTVVLIAVVAVAVTADSRSFFAAIPPLLFFSVHDISSPLYRRDDVNSMIFACVFVNESKIK